MVLLGSPRRTRDLDVIGSDLPTRPHSMLQQVLEQVAREMKIGIDPIPFEEFIPVPAGAEKRHRSVGQFGKLRVYVFDPYSIALSKIERGFKTDIEDVAFLLGRKIIVLEQLASMVEAMLPRAQEFGIDSRQMLSNLKSLHKRKM